ncbi:MAG: S-adenosylmethionine:tRNA ribosyltransferase-isomerase, partial [Planctomycetes bacterium]|nr:S-adenosylmethionine:tRNA ribosyltransferase-isomerase [Planctomycetota bacterium]
MRKEKAQGKRRSWKLEVMKTDELDYHLPEELIAQQALAERTQSRLLVLEQNTGTIAHRQFFEIAEILRAGDCLVINDSRVIPARFFARRQSGGKIEGLFLNLNEHGDWQVLLKNASRIKVGETLLFELVELHEPTETKPGLTVIERQERGGWLLRLESDVHYLDILQDYGVTPLPPYIRRQQVNALEDYDRSR